ncbi:MAG: polysulfide reductase NrfD [Magnetococcales bacterium]|nr:polysulfide reductase NrfD [Magnetococcales bacterium]
MMISEFSTIKGNSSKYLALLAGFGVLLALGAFSFLYVEINGHGATNMTNQVVWGLPHVFAISLLVMASGALNLASMATVFGAKQYKIFRRFSAFLAIALLAGGLAVLVLDLGRPDRMLLTMIHMNFKSMFTWNVFLYSGFVVLCFLYLWSMFQHERYVKLAGSAAFAGRVILTTGTGSIFGVIHAREVFHSAITGPTFVAVSITSGTAMCIMLLVATFHYTGRKLDKSLIHGLRNVLIFFTLLVFYLLVVEKFTKFYSPAFYDVESWILTGPYAPLYWIGVLGMGIALPLAILFNPGMGNSIKGIMWACGAAIIGEVSFVAHVLLAGQSYPFNMFPGWEMSSAFLDGQVAAYSPGILELMLGVGGIGIAGLIYLIGIRFFRLLPQKAEAPEGWKPWSP